MRKVILVLVLLAVAGSGVYMFNRVGADPFNQGIKARQQTFTVKRDGQEIVVQGNLLYTSDGRELVPMIREGAVPEQGFCEVDALVSLKDGVVTKVIRAAPKGTNIGPGEQVAGAGSVTTPLYVHRNAQGQLVIGCAAFYQLDQTTIQTALREAQAR